MNQILDKDFLLPIGKAKVMRQGSHVTLTAFSKMVGVCLDAAQQLAKEGIEAEVSQGRTSGLQQAWLALASPAGSLWPAELSAAVHVQD